MTSSSFVSGKMLFGDIRILIYDNCDKRTNVPVIRKDSHAPFLGRRYGTGPTSSHMTFVTRNTSAIPSKVTSDVTELTIPSNHNS